MIALLLNSGRGTRMGSETQEHTKCMVTLPGNRTIISHQLDLIRQLGIRRVVITTGPHADLLKEHVRQHAEGLDIRYVPNPAYASTNYIVSMLNASDLLQDDVLLLHGDLVTRLDVLQELCAANTSSVVIDRSLSLPDKDFKADLSDHRVLSIGVDVFTPHAAASQPAYRFLKQDMQRWLASIRTFVERGETACYAENALNPLLSDSIDLRGVDAGGRLCNEIDTPDDWQVVAHRFETEVLQ